ncbi:transposase [Atlantibacter hermannii]|uniref:transposase n=1 Tax=Atlantibacter hermannii TaxID=565 RepID=UPI0035E3FE81
MKKRFSGEQIISILREAEAGVSARELCRKHAISDATFCSVKRALRIAVSCVGRIIMQDEL